MRKTYTKPCLIVESFQLNAAVATSCANSVKNIINSTVSDCGSAKNPQLTEPLFTTACVENVNDSNDGEQLCYHAFQQLSSYIES